MIFLRKTTLKLKVLCFASFVFFTVDFKMFSQSVDKHLPILFFKENSIAFDTLFNYYENSERIMDTNLVLTSIVDILKKDTHLCLEIIGNSDRKEKKDLSKQRALKVYNYFLNKGITKDRLKYKFNGVKKPYVNEELIKRANNDSESKYLRRRNRRVCFLLSNK